MVLQKIGGGGEGSPWTLRRDDGKPTANYGEHLICNGGTVALPPPKDGEAVMVSTISQDVVIQAPSGQAEFTSSIDYNKDNPISFVSDGTDWYVANNLGYVGIIPDSVVSRPADNNSANNSNRQGVRIETNVEWPEIGGRISSNTANPTQAYIYRVSDGQLLGNTDISSLSAGDAFTISLSSNLIPGESYNFILDAEGSSYTLGFNNSPSFPYTSPDGDLSIVKGADGTSSTSNNVINIVEVGDVGF